MNITISELEDEISVLQRTLLIKQKLLQSLKEEEENKKEINNISSLSKEDIQRYCRQIILPELGVAGQIKLKSASVLIVGAGGLGCPSAIYLAGAGIGHIGIVDYDLVEISNLHRQILHTQGAIGLEKSISATLAINLINSSVKVDRLDCQLNSENILHILKDYDYVIDATDNVATRYLLNDACVLTRKPLISGSAVKFEGQLTVYNYKNGPCYRCIFPTPPPPDTVTNCGDGGVIGPVPGVIGTLQALETIKIILDHEGVLNGRLLLYDGIQTIFRTVKLRGKRANCAVCSEKPIITRLIDYEIFCGMRATDNNIPLTILESNERISVFDYNQLLLNNSPHVLIDVRSTIEYEMCHLKSSINLPIKSILDMKSNDFEKYENQNVYVICRRGNDSQLAVQHIKSTTLNKICAKDIIGGLQKWSILVDSSFPLY